MLHHNEDVFHLACAAWRYSLRGFGCKLSTLLGAALLCYTLIAAEWGFPQKSCGMERNVVHTRCMGSRETQR
jgi:hypothetical protein